jgi:hypothetical protein
MHVFPAGRGREIKTVILYSSIELLTPSLSTFNIKASFSFAAYNRLSTLCSDIETKYSRGAPSSQVHARKVGECFWERKKRTKESAGGVWEQSPVV